MPQMNKGCKIYFGKSLIRTDGTLRIPPQAMEEYHITDEGKSMSFTGSKITGGSASPGKAFASVKTWSYLDDTHRCLTTQQVWHEFIKYKGRSSYCWVEISQEGQILLTKKMMDF